MEKPDTLLNWERVIALRKHCEEAVLGVRQLEIELAGKHREQHPLSVKVVKAIFDMYENGVPLCCGAGRENLKSTGIDECWLEFVNIGAYEYLGCGDGDFKPGGKYYQTGKERLELILIGRYR